MATLPGGTPAPDPAVPPTPESGTPGGKLKLLTPSLHTTTKSTTSPPFTDFKVPPFLPPNDSNQPPPLAPLLVLHPMPIVAVCFESLPSGL